MENGKKNRVDLLQLALLWAVLTMCCWGSYGPLLAQATMLLGGSVALAMSLIGLGYGLAGVLVGSIILKLGVVPDKGNWNSRGWAEGFKAGALGVGGNLCLIMALKLYHRPEVVMPLVFGGVQLFNTIFTCIAEKRWPKPGFVFGVLLLAIGVVTVLVFRPGQSRGDEALNWWFAPCVIGVWMCWGKYGVQVHASIVAFGMSGLRSMISISATYVLLAMCGGLVAYGLGIEPNAQITAAGFWKGILAGVITTAGAWGIVFGNRYVKGGPSVVMPLVFAGAPVVNTFFAMWLRGTSWSSTHPLMWIGIVVVAIGGYLVLTNKPEKDHPVATKAAS